MRYFSWLEYIILLLPSFFSFLYFAPASPHALYLADSSIFLLMAKDFDGVKSLYYWGQNRNGALVSFLTHYSHKFIPIIGIELLYSLIYFGFIWIGLWCFSRFLTSPISRITLGFFWLLPFCTAYLLVGQPYCIQLSLIGIALFLVTRPLNFLKAFLCTVCLGGSVWISDAAIVQILILIPLVRELKLSKKSWIGAAYGLFLSTIWIIIAKHYAVTIVGYGSLATPNETLSLLHRILTYYFANIPSNIGLTLISSLTLVTLVSSIALRHRSTSWISRYSFYSILSNLLICSISTWVTRENSDFLRYLTPIYIWLIFLILLQIESFSEVTHRRTRKALMVFALIISLLIANDTHLIINASVTAPNLPKGVASGFRSPPLMNAIHAFQPMGQTTGIIGDYWSAYLWCDIDDRFTCTPHDQSVVIQPKYIDQVKQKDVVYLIKDFWFEAFPDEIVQFGKPLKRVGDPQLVHSYTLAPYRWK